MKMNQIRPKLLQIYDHLFCLFLIAESLAIHKKSHDAVSEISGKLRDPESICIRIVLFSAEIDSSLHSGNPGEVIDNMTSGTESGNAVDECDSQWETSSWNVSG